MNVELTPLERSLVELLESRLDGQAAIPSYEEIRQALHLSSKDHVSRLINSLERKGYIRRQPGKSRSLQLLRGSDHDPIRFVRTVRIPLLALVPASFGVDTHDGFEPDAYLELTRDLIPDDKGIYALRVSGSSMVDAMINDGDIVILRHQEEAANNDLVQVWINSEQTTTLKRYSRRGDRICLKPENPRLPPRYFRADDVKIQGKVVMVIRHLERDLAAAA
ncbi:MAG: repressor LexA [Caldilineae bacterium]|nr:MAG: repressor LexA [Caldilineae bacterium]